LTLVEAIQKAIGFESRIHETYRNAADRVKDPAGRRVLQALALDERRHLDYLTDRLNALASKGVLDLDYLDSALKPIPAIHQDENQLGSRLGRDDLGDEKRILSQALKLEIETSRFYQTMSKELTDQGRQLFQRFLQLENEHIDVVQAELDHLSKTGYWFGFKEFDME